VATEILTPASVPGHLHLDTDSTGRPITSFTGLLRAADETPIAKMLARKKAAASSKLPVPTGASPRKSGRLALKDNILGRLNESRLSKRSVSPKKSGEIDVSSAGGPGSPAKKPAAVTGATSKVPMLKRPSVSPKKKGVSPKKASTAALAPVENETRTARVTRSRSQSPTKEQVKLITKKAPIDAPAPVEHDTSTVRVTRARSKSPVKEQVKPTPKKKG
jgi:hypothetical protein